MELKDFQRLKMEHELHECQLEFSAWFESYLHFRRLSLWPFVEESFRWLTSATFVSSGRDFSSVVCRLKSSGCHLFFWWYDKSMSLLSSQLVLSVWSSILRVICTYSVDSIKMSNRDSQPYWLKQMNEFPIEKFISSKMPPHRFYNVTKFSCNSKHTWLWIHGLLKTSFALLCSSWTTDDES